jgi:hypothetical protein
MRPPPFRRAGRPDEDDHGHEDEDDDLGERRQVRDAVGLDQPDEEPGDDGAEDGPEAADDDDREEDDDEVASHVGRDRPEGGREHAREARESDAEAEHRRHPTAHVDAERASPLGGLRRGAHDHADPGLGEQEADADADRDGEETGEELVGREVEAAHGDLAAEPGGNLVGQTRHAVPQLHGLDEDEREAEGEQEVVERVEVEQPPHEQPLHEDAEQEHDDRHEDEGDPEVHLELGEQDGGKDGPEHVGRAVGEVDDAEDAEDHGEAERGEGIEASGREALQGVLDELTHVTVRSRV